MPTEAEAARLRGKGMPLPNGIPAPTLQRELNLGNFEATRLVALVGQRDHLELHRRIQRDEGVQARL